MADLDQSAAALQADSLAKAEQLKAALEVFDQDLSQIDAKSYPGIPLAIPSMIERIKRDTVNWQMQLTGEVNRLKGEEPPIHPPHRP